MKLRYGIAGALLSVLAVPALADEHAGRYAFDTKGTHQFIQFRISHLGYSWLYGRFNTFDGSFAFDPADPAKSSVTVTVDTRSVDSNHAERDKHLRSPDFLDVEKFPEATFVSKRIELASGDKSKVTAAKVIGDLTLHGVTRELALDVAEIGHGKDPWGGYRMGFSASTSFRLADFGIPPKLGPTAENIYMTISVEGVRQ